MIEELQGAKKNVISLGEDLELDARKGDAGRNPHHLEKDLVEQLQGYGSRAGKWEKLPSFLATLILMDLMFFSGLLWKRKREECSGSAEGEKRKLSG